MEPITNTAKVAKIQSLNSWLFLKLDFYELKYFMFKDTY